MVVYKGMPRATAPERAHMARVKALPCCICVDDQRSPTEVHHLVSGNKRMGHFFVIPLCGECHRQIHQISLRCQQLWWIESNEQLGITRDWPASKIVPRSVA